MQMFRNTFLNLAGFLVVGLLMALPENGFTQVTVDYAILHFKFGQRPVQNVVVGNSSDRVIYVTATVEEVLDPEAGGNKSQPTDTLLASPKTFSVEANGQRTVRLLLRQIPADKEKVYRVIFSPQDRGFGQEVRQDIGGRVAVIRVLSGMGVLLFADPVNPHTALSWVRTADSIVFKNDGNVHVQLAEGKSCAPDNNGDCTTLDAKRIYGGSSYEIKVPENRRVTYLRRDGVSGEYQALTIEPGVSPSSGESGKEEKS